MDSLKFHADFSAMTRYRTKIHESFLSFVLCFNFANFDSRVWWVEGIEKFLNRMYAIVESPYENNNNNIEEKNIEKVLDEELIMKLS